VTGEDDTTSEEDITLFCNNNENSNNLFFSSSFKFELDTIVLVMVDKVGTFSFSFLFWGESILLVVIDVALFFTETLLIIELLLVSNFIFLKVEKLFEGKVEVENEGLIFVAFGPDFSESFLFLEGEEEEEEEEEDGGGGRGGGRGGGELFKLFSFKS
jgi:hypothetical protein